MFYMLHFFFGLVYVLGAQTNCLIETCFFFSTHNIFTLKWLSLQLYGCGEFSVWLLL